MNFEVKGIHLSFINEYWIKLLILQRKPNN